MSFRVKSLLTPFFKIAHPDILHSAPSHVQKTNTFALSNLNSYIDSVSQGQAVSLSSLVFYVPRGNAQYKECRIPLLPLKSDASNSAKSLHLESLVNSINLAISNPETIEEPEQIEPQTRPRMRNQIFNSMTSQYQKYLLLKSQMDHISEIDKKVSIGIEKEHIKFHPSDFGMKSRKADPLVQAAISSSVSATLFKTLQKTFVRLDKLFIDEDLKEQDVHLGLYKVAGKNLTVEESKSLLDIYNGLRENGFGLVISNRYSICNVPGALQIPFDFKLKELVEYSKGNFDKIQEKLSDFFYFRDKTEKILRYLSIAYVPCTLGRYLYRNNEKFEEVAFSEMYRAVKKLKQMLDKGELPKGLQDCVIVIGVEYSDDKGFIQIPVKFAESQLVEFLKNKVKTQII